MKDQELMSKIKSLSEEKKNTENELVKLYVNDKGIQQIANHIEEKLDGCEFIQFDECGFIESIIELPGDAVALNEYQKQALQEIGLFHLADGHASRCIDVPEECVIYDQREGKFFYSGKEFETKEDALKAAELDGLYPSVYSQGYYGDLSFYK